MAYPPPPRQPSGRRPPPGMDYGPPQDGYYDHAYGYDYNYQYGDGGYDDGYGYYGDYASPRSYGPPPRAPKSHRPRGPPVEPPYDPGYLYDGRPPYGPDGRRGPPKRPPPRGDRMRPRESNDQQNTPNSHIDNSQAGGRPPRPPQPPGSMGYDNPYPSYPPRDKRYPPPAGVERGMAAMDLNGPAPPGRMPDRPHTSSGRRTPGGPPGAPPGRGRGYPPPSRSASGGRRPDRMERSYTDLNGAPPMPGFSRSATMPVGEPPMNKPMYPGQHAYQDPGSPNTVGAYPPMSDLGHDPNERFDTHDFLDSYYGDPHADEREMPNFDAMPDNQRGAIDENLPGLESPSKAPPPPSSGGQYAPYVPQSGGRSHPAQRGATAPSQFAAAGFEFDLPNTHHQNNMGYGYEEPPNAPYPQVDYDRQGSTRNNGPPRPYRVNQPGASQPPTNATEGLDAQQNPDALPSHPTPFRPGHDKPAPVRQYTAPPSNQPPPQPAQNQPGEQSGPVTQQELHQLQQMANSHPSNRSTQLLLAKKLAEAAVVLVDQSRADPKTKAKAREKYVTDSYKIVKKLVQQGYTDAQFFMADCYGSGQLGLPADPKEAFSLYHSAAKQGHGQSAYRVAVCCEIGQEDGGGTKRDPFKAVQWYKRAAALGDTPAMYKLGMISLKGLLGQARNPREGITWLKRAAERADPENPHALHELALIHSNANGDDVVVRDDEYASQLFHQAAELGYKFSQFRLGSAYEYGLLNCPVDPRQSIVYYTHAASQGEHQAELALSGWYLTGAEGILQQSDTEAYLWARKAATAGLAKAEYAMGYFTEVGIGASSNLDDAKRWYWRAAAQGFPKARERLEDLKKGGAKMQKTRLSRSNVNRQNEGDCVVM